MTATNTKKLLEHQWHNLPLAEVARSLNTQPNRGLSSAEVTQRQQQYVANELKSKPGKSPIIWFLLQFNQPLLYILIVAGIVKALLGSWANAWVIWGVTIINAIIGYVQESKAESAIAALASAVKTEATVLRDGQKVRVSSTELVPGDVVLLASGDKVPTDLRLIDLRNLQINESALTGESVAVEKNTQQLGLCCKKREREKNSLEKKFLILILDTKVPAILIGLPEAETVFQFNSQLSRRFANIHNLSPFSWENSGREFRTFIHAVETQLPLTEESALACEEMAIRFYYTSDGIVAYVII